MRKIILDQLQACSYAKIQPTADPNVFIIPKYTKPHFEPNKCYLIQIPLNIINNNTNTLATNWNNSNSPQYEYLKIFINKSLGKMIYVDSLAFDMNTKTDINATWSGWLPTEEIVQLACLG